MELHHSRTIKIQFSNRHSQTKLADKKNTFEQTVCLLEASEINKNRELLIKTFSSTGHIYKLRFGQRKIKLTDARQNILINVPLL